MRFSLLFALLSAAWAFADPLTLEPPLVTGFSAGGLQGATYRYQQDGQKTHGKRGGNTHCIELDALRSAEGIGYQIMQNERAWMNEVWRRSRATLRLLGAESPGSNLEYDRFHEELLAYVWHRGSGPTYSNNCFWFYATTWIWAHIAHFNELHRESVSCKLNNLIRVIERDNRRTWKPESTDPGYLLAQFEEFIAGNPDYVEPGSYSERVLDLLTYVFDHSFKPDTPQG